MMENNTNHNINFKASIRKRVKHEMLENLNQSHKEKYWDILSDYYRLSIQPELSELEMKRIASILSMAETDKNLALYIDTLDDFILQAWEIFVDEEQVDKANERFIEINNQTIENQKESNRIQTNKELSAANSSTDSAKVIPINSDIDNIKIPSSSPGESKRLKGDSDRFYRQDRKKLIYGIGTSFTAVILATLVIMGADQFSDQHYQSVDARDYASTVEGNSNIAPIMNTRNNSISSDNQKSRNFVPDANIETEGGINPNEEASIRLNLDTDARDEFDFSSINGSHQNFEFDPEDIEAWW